MVNTRSKKLEYTQPVTKTFEFLGPHGAIGTLLALPLVVAYLFLICNERSCSPWPLDFNFLSSRIASERFFDLSAFAVYVAWMALHFILAVVVPGEVVKGAPLPTPSGDRLDYKLNGLASMFISAGLVGLLVWVYGLAPLVWVADHYFPLAVAGILFSSVLSLLLYIWSHRSDKVVVAKGGNSGYVLYDLWMGRELNPRVCSGMLDLKFVCELRPGLIGWAVINAAHAAKQFAVLGRITNSMVLVIAAQGYYVLDALLNERAILTTMDITTDGFGFMLAFGDLVWVPFTYTVQSRFLTMYPQDLSVEFLGVILGLNFLGLYVFRSANSEKNAFRTNPDAPEVAHLTYLKTESGSRLLTSGWWGLARKINYTGMSGLLSAGDWMMSVAWCLPCGFSSIIPYFYCIYFAVLLIHRAGRDDEICSHKYGKDWEKYKELVPYRFFPGLW
ncbi:hypothetical protein HDV03_002180 [Kappamyces sp. JEL0829]|nr:hypothetical protein HDV03_002180 [Kappamyces sp. JEL0829]